MRLTFVRHTSVAVERGVCYGRTDVPLAASFPGEAEAVRRRLGEKPFANAYCSPLGRCRRLAEYCGYPDAKIDDRLLEMDFGEWEMRRYDDITDPRLQEWYDDYLNVRATGGESFADQRRRLDSFIDELRERNVDQAVIFTHCGIIMQAMLAAGAATAENMFDLQPAYGDVIELVF